VGGFKIDRGRAVVIQRTFPPRDADTPFVTRLQPGKSPFRARGDQIVPVEHGKIEKFLGDFYANRVQPNVFRTSPTKSVAIKAGDRITTATFQFASENVGGHEASLTPRFSLLNIGLLKMGVGSECVFQA
jgi:hypothetical protein